MVPYADFLYFGILFLAVVLPTVALGLMGRKVKSWLVMATSLMLIVQYAWPVTGEAGDPFWQELATLLGFAALQFVVARGYLVMRRHDVSKKWITPAILLSLSPLVLAKLLPAHGGGNLVGFIGISYLSFRAIDVLMCIHEGTVKELRTSDFLLFLLFFPTISSGPIDRFRRFKVDWDAPRSRPEFLKDLDYATASFFSGLLYKFVLSAVIYDEWLTPVSSHHGFGALVSYTYAYSFYLFFDFAGYSAFAIAFSYLLGIRTPQNFNLPFLAPDIQAFWNRWHITLSHWLRDFVFMRFYLWITKKGWIKNPVHASHAGLLVTFFTMGLWHGLERHYLVYGLYHGGLQVIHDRYKRWNKNAQWLADTRFTRALGTALTFNCVCFGFLIFSGHWFR
ncbi:MAG TPA: D-alanyl-lipoteichoic acid biosynthesis protein DltB [Chthoniobacterales bacterium]|nr:D-alanyl-lipoteichoic acid biosynthesis protein DltB [Chthoniobacterales bacterium]